MRQATDNMIRQSQVGSKIGMNLHKIEKHGRGEYSQDCRKDHKITNGLAFVARVTERKINTWSLAFSALGKRLHIIPRSLVLHAKSHHQENSAA